MLTSSDSQALRLTAAEGVPPAVHAVFRFRPGGGIAVVTFSNFEPAPPGKTYQAWALFGGRWRSIGTAEPDGSGKARLIAEGPEFGARPEALKVTREPRSGSASPAGVDVVRWEAGPSP
jgi:hypothetical protein